MKPAKEPSFIIIITMLKIKKFKDSKEERQAHQIEPSKDGSIIGRDYLSSLMIDFSLAERNRLKDFSQLFCVGFGLALEFLGGFDKQLLFGLKQRLSFFDHQLSIHL